MFQQCARCIVATAVKLEEKIKPPMGCVPSYYFKKKQSRLMELLLLVNSCVNRGGGPLLLTLAAGFRTG
jgi:hypothetical protein